jgi:hypothetical protein
MAPDEAVDKFIIDAVARHILTSACQDILNSELAIRDSPSAEIRVRR